MFCMRCGAALPEGAKFCTACGQPAGAPPAKAAAPAASPAFSRYLALVEGRAGAPGPGERRWKHRGCGWFPSPPNAHDARLKRPSYRFGAGAVLRGR